MKRIIILAIVLLCSMRTVHATYLAAGTFMPNMESQDSEGEKVKFQFNPSLMFGHNFGPLSWLWGHRFSPAIGYTFHKSTDDAYGEQTKRTIFLLYDFAWSVAQAVVVRYGVGNFITHISGDGGTVSVPSGLSTSTAYRPGESVNSYNSSLNLGLELWAPARIPVRALGIRGEAHLMQFLSSEKRTLGYTIFVVGYF